MSVYFTQPITFGGVRTYPLASRKSKVNVSQFARPVGSKVSLARFLDALPDILAARDLRTLLSSIHLAKKQKKAILWGLGGHVIKVGLGPLLVDLMKRGFVSGVAMNGAAMIHDFEVAMVGNTSEDVETGLGRGRVRHGRRNRKIHQRNGKAGRAPANRLRRGCRAVSSSGVLSPKHPESSVLMAAYRLRIPVTVHVAIGTDIAHIHPTTAEAHWA